MKTQNERARAVVEAMVRSFRSDDPFIAAWDELRAAGLDDPGEESARLAWWRAAHRCGGLS